MKVTNYYNKVWGRSIKGYIPLNPILGHIFVPKRCKMCHSLEKVNITSQKLHTCIKTHWYTNGDIVLTKAIDYDQIWDIIGVKMGVKRVKMCPFLGKVNIISQKIAFMHQDIFEVKMRVKRV